MRANLPLLTFEGGEGVGKSTQVARCKRYLEEHGHAVLTTREPGGTKRGESLRAFVLQSAKEDWDPIAELCLFNAARAQHIYEVLRPGLAGGTVVLCDRYFDSSIAYQGTARDIPPDRVAKMCLDVVGECLPWRTFWLDHEPETALARAHQCRLFDQDRFEDEGLDFHQKVRNGYLWCLQEFPERFFRIDATGNPEAVFERLKDHLDEFLKVFPGKAETQQLFES